MQEIKLSAPDFSDREREHVAALFDDPLFLLKPDTLNTFARAMCDVTGFAHAYPVSSGTTAMHLALVALGIGAGDEVWTTSMTFMGGVSPLTLVGARPVFVDIAPDSWTIDCDLLEEELAKAASENRLPKAIIPTDLYGQASDMDRLVAMAERYGLVLVSDSAEGLGARCRDRHAGKGARAAILSFNTNKIITSAGGGMILSDDPAIVGHAAKLANQARENVLHYQHEEIGFNYRMSPISAVIGRAQLETLEARIARRRAIFARYAEALAGVPGIGFMPEPAWSRSTRWLSCMTIDPGTAGLARDDVIAACAAAGIETRPLWKPMHLQPVFQRMGTRFFGSGLCERLFDTGLCLPSGSGMTGDEIERVVAALAKLLG